MFECVICGRMFHDEDDVEYTEEGYICHICMEEMEDEGYIEEEQEENEDDY